MQAPQAPAQQYYQQGDNPPPPGFIMPGAVGPSMPPQQATSSNYSMYSQAGTRPAYPQTYQATQQYSSGTGGPALYQPQQPVAVPASASYPSPAPNTTPSYLPSAPAHSMPSPLYPGQPQPSPTSLNPISSYPVPPSGTSFQHGRPGPPATSVAYALPTGPTGTLPATSDLPASQRTGLRLDRGAGREEGGGRSSPTQLNMHFFPCECSAKSLLLLRDQFKAFLNHIITPVHP